MRAAFATERGARRLQRDLVEAPGLRVHRGIDAGQLLVDQHVAGALLLQRQALVVGLLEGVEGAHHLGMRHHRVERYARFGLKLGMGIDIHLVLLLNGFWFRQSPCWGVAEGFRIAA